MLRRSNSFVNMKPREAKNKRTMAEDTGASSSSLPFAYSSSVGGSMSRGLKTPTNRFQSLFSPFNKAQDHMEQLNSILQGYTLRGMPRIPDLYTRGRPHYDRSQFLLEDNWTEVVSSHVNLSRHQKDQQEAIWELLTTEVQYIHKLKVIIDVFFCCLINSQSQHILKEIETEKVFCNIVDVYYATCHFWVNHISQVLRVARETREPLNPCLLKAGFLVFDKIFEPYTQYCIEQESCLDYIRARMKDNELFRTFILWGETQIECNRLKLVDLIVKPWQRLTKYKLLLFAMKRPLEKMEASSSSSNPSPALSQDQKEQIKGISEAIEQVEKFVNYINMTMRKRQDCRQLSNMIERIETYDALDSLSEECDKLASDYCKVDSVLTCPIPGCSQQELRIVLLEGNLKLKDANTKMDVYCFLFTDLLLVTKPAAKRGDKIRVIKPPMRLDKIVVHSLKDNSSFLLLYLNEYQMAQSAYTFHGDSKLWIDNITKAQIDYREKRSLHMTLSESLILDMYDDGDDDYPSSVERPSSAEPNISNETCQTKSTLQRSLSFVNLLNSDGQGKSRQKLGLLAANPNQKRSKSQTFLPACSFSRLDDQCEAGEAVTETKSNYLCIPQALASVSGMFREFPTPNDDENKSALREVGMEYDPHRTRLNQRRLARGERRYYTANAVQDLKAKKPPTSLHKHRSWNCAGDDKVQPIRSSWSSTSTDSVQSNLSSSGISSCGSSMRMSRESEICEETENELLEAKAEVLEDDDDDDDEDVDIGTNSVEEDSLLYPHRYTKTNNIGTQTPPDVMELSHRTNRSSPCSQLWRSPHSRSMPNISSTDASEEAMLSNDASLRTTDKCHRIRKQHFSPFQKLCQTTQPLPTAVKISDA